MFASLLAATLLSTPVLQPKPSIDLKIERYVLPNGLTVILHEDHTVPIATINTWFRVGSKDEPERRSGFAHLFEHLMFMGTNRVPQGQFDTVMESLGGNNNATTSQDRTNYFSTGPSHILPILLWLDADRLEALGKNIDQKKLDLQRDVVKNERRQGVENQPYGEAWEAITKLVYPKDHPYHAGVIGSHEDLSAATVNDVQEFFASNYVPNNAALVVAGDFDSQKVKPLVERLFGTLPRGNEVLRKPVPPVPSLGDKRVTMVNRVQQAQTIMVWHSPAAYQSGDVELSLAAAVLADGVGSRLYRELVTERKLATEVSSFQGSQLLGSLFYVVATAAEGVAPGELEAGIDRVLADFRRGGPTKEELQRQVAKQEYDMLSNLQSIEWKADRLNEYEFFLGKPDSFNEVLNRIRETTSGAVRDAFRKTVVPNNRLTLRVVPLPEPGEGPNPRDAKPEPGQPASFSPPLPTTVSVAPGIEFYYFHRPDLPLTTLSAQFLSGAEADAPGKKGATALMASMLSEGAGELDSVAFEAALEKLGARFGAAAGGLATTASLDVLTANFDKALPLFADALRRPRFASSEWERVQRVTVAGLEQEVDDPSTVARKLAMRELFGPDHPAGLPNEGTVQSVKGLSLEDVKAAYQRTIRPDRVAFFGAGSMPLEEMKAKLAKAFEGWQATGTPAPLPADPNQANPRLRVVIVDREGAPQTAIRVAMPGMPYGSPDRRAATALGVTLGGTFTSRLNANLREDKGYTYGAGSRFVFHPSYGYVVASADVQTEVTGASLKEILAELRKIRTGDVTSEESAKAAASLRSGMIQSAATIQGLVRLAMDQRSYGQPVVSYTEELRALEKVAEGEINRIAASSLPLEQAVIVLVGDRKQILPQLKDLGLPEPEVPKD